MFDIFYKFLVIFFFMFFYQFLETYTIFCGIFNNFSHIFIKSLTFLQVFQHFLRIFVHFTKFRFFFTSFWFLKQLFQLFFT